MPGKTPPIIAGLLTFLILIVLGIVLVFGEIILLNGASESEGFKALSTSVICQSVSLLISVILARWLANLTIMKFKWNNTLAVVTATTTGVLLGGGIFFLSIILSILMAGIR